MHIWVPKKAENLTTSYYIIKHLAPWS